MARSSSTAFRPLSVSVPGWPVPHAGCAATAQYRGHAQQQWDGHVFARPLPCGEIVDVGRKLDGEVAPIHGAAIPFQPEPHMPLPDPIVRQRIRPQVVPLLIDPVAPFALRAGFPPTQGMVWLLSCRLGEMCKKAIHARGILDMLPKERDTRADNRCTLKWAKGTHIFHPLSATVMTISYPS